MTTATTAMALGFTREDVFRLSFAPAAMRRLTFSGRADQPR